jgi:hypothetical protein
MKPMSHFEQVLASVQVKQSARQLVQVSLLVLESMLVKYPSLHYVQLLKSEVWQPKHPAAHYTQLYLALFDGVGK